MLALREKIENEVLTYFESLWQLWFKTIDTIRINSIFINWGQKDKFCLFSSKFQQKIETAKAPQASYSTVDIIISLYELLDKK